MMREKMPRAMRAKQFLPFDAVAGLRQALRVKEYEIESVQKGLLAEEEAREISGILSSLRGMEEVEAKYFSGGHYLFVNGPVKLFFEEGFIVVGETKILLKDLFGIRVLHR